MPTSSPALQTPERTRAALGRAPGCALGRTGAMGSLPEPSCPCPRCLQPPFLLRFPCKPSAPAPRARCSRGGEPKTSSRHKPPQPAACTSVPLAWPADSRGFPYGGRWLYLSFLAALIHAPGRPGRGMVTPCNPSPCGLIKPSFPPRPPSGRWGSLTGLCGVTARSPGFASTPRLSSGWILLHKTVALQEAPKAAPCPARTHCTYNSCPHNHGRPHRAISPPRAAPQRTQGPSAPRWQARAENQQQRSGDRPGLQPNQHFWGEGCC